MFIHILTVIFILVPFGAFGAGFLIYNQDAKAVGMGMACASSIDNASAVFFNPANLPKLETRGFMINTTIIRPQLSYRDQTSGQKFNARSETHNLYSLYFYNTWDNKSFGIGLFSPFGLSTEWKIDFPGRYYSLLSSLRTVFLNPVFATRITEKTRFALGLSYVSSSVKFKAMLPSPIGIDGLSVLTGKGEGIGYNFASTIELPYEYTFSLTFRSPVRIKYEGKGKVYMPSPLSSFTTDCYTYFTLPYLIVLGLSKNIGNTTFEIDAIYSGWSSMNTYRIRSENGLLDKTYHKRWSNTFSFCAGINYRMEKAINFQIGYMYDITPVPLSTRGPELPDATRNIFAIGGTYEKGNLRFGISYQATYFKKAKSTLPGLLGRYRNFAHLGLVHFGYSR